jgi:DNA-binding transcriptional regulator WhiA
MKICIPKEVSLELAEETGWHIGDGSMNYYKNKEYVSGLYQLRGHIEDDKEHYIKRIKPIFKLLYDVNINLREMPSTRVFGFQIWNSDLIRFKEKLGLQIGPKLEVAIPKIFLENDDLKISIIRGIFDTDGGIYLENKNNKLYPRLEIKTISQKLANQLFQIFNELGIRTTKYLNYFNKSDNRKQAYVITIRGDEMFHKFIEIIKPANPKHIKKYLLYRKGFKQ